MAEDCAAIPPGTRCRDEGSPPCATDADCAEQSICVPPSVHEPELGYVCYAPKMRYVSIARNPDQCPYTARRIKLGDAEGTVLGWVGEPYLHESGDWLAEVVDVPHYAVTWPDVVHVYTCPIAPASLCEDTGQHCNPNNCPGHPDEQCINHRYGIQAIYFEDDIGDEDAYSDVLWLNTASTWGDTVGSCAGNVCKPADGQPGLDDIMAAIAYFMGNKDVAPLVWLDIDPSNLAQSPDQLVGLGDIMGAIAGFQGEAYPGLGPKNCP